MGSREEPLIREAKPQKPKAFCLPEVQMRHKFVHCLLFSELVKRVLNEYCSMSVV